VFAVRMPTMLRVRRETAHPQHHQQTRAV